MTPLIILGIALVGLIAINLWWRGKAAAAQCSVQLGCLGLLKVL